MTTTTPITVKVDEFADAVAAEVVRLGSENARMDQVSYENWIQQRLLDLYARLSPSRTVAANGSGNAISQETTRADTRRVVLNPDRGMDAVTGQKLAKTAHIQQSLTDIWTTAVGSRVMRRDYGSKIPALVDAPLNEPTLLNLIHAAAEAALKWENRISKLVVVVAEVIAGKLTLSVLAEDEDGNPIDFYEVLAS